MKNYFVPRWVLLGSNGAGWLPNVSLIADDMPHRLEEVVIGHEGVHQIQQDELGYFTWVFKYSIYHCKYGYKHNPLELDAYRWGHDINNRPKFAWKEYLDVK